MNLLVKKKLHFSHCKSWFYPSKYRIIQIPLLPNLFSFFDSPRHFITGLASFVIAVRKNMSVLRETIFQAIRLEQDRLCMCYEDQLSHSQREVIKLQQKCNKWKDYLRRTKNDYDDLQAKLLQRRQHDARKSEKPLVSSSSSSSRVAAIPDTTKPPTATLTLHPARSEKRKADEALGVNATEHTDHSPVKKSTKGIISVKEERRTNENSPKKNVPAITDYVGTFASGSSSNSNSSATESRNEQTRAIASTNSKNSVVGSYRTTTTTMSPPKGPISKRSLTAGKRSISAVGPLMLTSKPLDPNATAVSSSSSKSDHREPTTHVPKFVDVVRKKDERAALPGHTCTECARFYDVMIEQGILQPEGKGQFLQLCSRHKAQWAPPDTPDGFWDLSINTPAAWKNDHET